MGKYMVITTEYYSLNCSTLYSFSVRVNLHI
nr:MAG TPA: hypothetical protein [Caudoviricetes sp.]